MIGDRLPLSALLLTLVGLGSGCADASDASSEDLKEGDSAFSGVVPVAGGELVPAQQARAWAAALEGTWKGSAHAATEQDVSAWIEAVPGTLAVVKSAGGRHHEVVVEARGAVHRFGWVDLGTIAKNPRDGGAYVVSLDPGVDPRDVLADPEHRCWMTMRPEAKDVQVTVFCNASAGKLLSYIDVAVPGLKSAR
jgi:hypothetical protein